jgi:hypothetical protein
MSGRPEGWQSDALAGPFSELHGRPVVALSRPIIPRFPSLGRSPIICIVTNQ